MIGASPVCEAKKLTCNRPLSARRCRICRFTALTAAVALGRSQNSGRRSLRDFWSWLIDKCSRIFRWFSYELSSDVLWFWKIWSENIHDFSWFFDDFGDFRHWLLGIYWRIFGDVLHDFPGLFKDLCGCLRSSDDLWGVFGFLGETFVVDWLFGLFLGCWRPQSSVMADVLREFRWFLVLVLIHSAPQRGGHWLEQEELKRLEGCSKDPLVI